MVEFFDEVKSPVTQRKYELSMRQFLSWIYDNKIVIEPTKKGLKFNAETEKANDSMTRKLVRDFAVKTRTEPDWATGAISDFLCEVRARVTTGHKERKRGFLR